MLRRGLSLLGSAWLGAGLMYVFDPNRGRTRRRLARAKAAHWVNASADGLEVATRDLSHRANGLTAGMRSRLSREPVSDEVLVARVRAMIGRVVAHPRTIMVVAENGRVVLSGQVQAPELPGLLRTVRSVSGVREVENRLAVDEQAVPDAVRREVRSELMQENWSPGIRLLVGAAGGLLAVTGLWRRGVVGSLGAATGLGLLVRAGTNLPMNRLLGIGAGRRGITIRKTLTVDAPISQVYDFWCRPEGFSRFMPHVREVRPLGEGRTHWEVAGPAGMPVSWNARITQQLPNQLLAWESEPGSVVQSTGTIRFGSNPDGRTQVQIKLVYCPPAGALGHAVAALFAADPKHRMDLDLGALKPLLEQELRQEESTTL